MKALAEPTELSRAQLVELMITRLKGAGWKASPCLATDRNAALANLLPEPDEVLTLCNAVTGEQGQAALSFTQWNGRTSYACTVYRSGGDVVVERGHLDERSAALEHIESRGELAANGYADASRPVASRVERFAEAEAPRVAELAAPSASPKPAASRIPRPPRIAATSLPPSPDESPRPEEKRVRNPLPARAVDVGSDANALALIVAEVEARGAYACRWAELRRHHFPGPEGWSRLKDWCTTKSIDCALSFVQSSKAAEVQFRRPQAQP